MLVAAAILLATGINASNADGVRRPIRQIIGAGCEPAEPPQLSECVASESGDKVALTGEFNVRFVDVKLEGGVEYVRQTRSNGQVAITVKLPTSGGIGPPMSKALQMGGKLDGVIKAGQTPQVTFVLRDVNGGTSSSSRSPTRRSRSPRTLGQTSSGDITAYYRVDGKLAGEGGLLVGEGAGGALADFDRVRLGEVLGTIRLT
jgi:hypothetical protein